MARPTKFNEELKDKALELFAQGKTDVEVAKELGVTEKTLNNWKQKHPEFFQSLKDAKSAPDQQVEDSLFMRACGFERTTFQDVEMDGRVVRLFTQKYYPPDTIACIFWLKNRRPERWREKMPGDNDVKITVTLADRLAKARARARGAK